MDAIWNLDGTGDFNTGANWDGGIVPDRTAFFGLSNQNDVVISADATLSGWTFNAGASNYTFANDSRLEFTGAGIIINGGSAAIVNTAFVVFSNESTAGGSTITNRSGGATFFDNSSKAGNAVIVNRFGSLTVFDGFSTAENANITNRFGGTTLFSGSSGAGSAVITNRFGGVTAFDGASSADNAIITNRFGGGTYFAEDSSAGNATIFNNSPGGFAFPVGVGFFDESSAGTATIINGNNGTTIFGQPFGLDTASASSATIINNFGGATAFAAFSSAASATIVTNDGGMTFFGDNSTGGNAQFITEGTGIVDFSGSLGPNGDGQIRAGSIAGSGRYFIGAGNTLTVGGNHRSTEVSGVIADFDPCGCAPAGPGALVKTGDGTLTLSGDNTYTGGTTVDAGKLVIGNGGASGSIMGKVTVNAGAAFGVNRSDVYALPNMVTGAGNFEQLGTGTTVLGDGMTYTGTTSIVRGTLQIGNGGSEGSIGTGDILNSATLAINKNNSFTLTNNITGMGNLNQIGPGNTTLTGSNTYTGATNVMAGTLTAGALGTFSPNSAFTVSVGALLDLAGLNQTIGSLAGAGNVDLGAGTLTTGGNNTSTTFSGNITGTGGLSKAGMGTFILTGNNNDYTGPTSILAGALQIGNGGAGGSIGAGNILNSALLIVNKGIDYALPNDITGTGAFRHNGTGTTTLGGNNTYSGATDVNAGTLRAAIANAFSRNSAFTVAGGATLDLNDINQTIASLAGAGNVDLGSATLTTGGSNASTTFSGTIVGTGGLTKVGTGTFALTGNHTYTGPTNVLAGTLALNGTLLSTINVNGGTLSGNGTAGNVNVINGNFAPGASIGTFNITGNLTFAAAGNYVVEVSPQAADRTIVTGAATLGGTLRAVFEPGSGYIARNYTVISAAGGRTGEFATFDTSNLPTSFNASLTYTDTDVVLNLTSQFQDALLRLTGFNRNQQAVASTLDATFNAGVPFVGGFTALLTLPDVLLPGTLSQLSGEIGTSAPAAGFRSMDLFLQMMLDPFVSGRNTGASGPAPIFAPGLAFDAATGPRAAENAYAASMPVKARPASSFDSRWSVWGGAYGGRERRDGDALTGSQNLTARVGGFAAGADYRANSSVFGVAVGMGETSFGLANGLGTGRTEFAQAGVYGSTRLGPAYVSAALAYAWHQASTNRTVALGAFETLKGEFDAQNLGARIEAGWRQVTPWVAVTPYAALVAQSFRMAGYTESAAAGLGSLALGYGGRTATSTRSELGAWFDRSYAFGPNSALTLRGRAAWLHDYSREPSIGAAFPTLAGASFVVTGAAPSHDAALVSAASELAFANGISLSAKFDGEFAAASSSFAGTGTLRRVW